MKEKIYQYLKAKGQYVTAEELLEQFFHVFNAQPDQMQRIIDSLLNSDPRFVKDEEGKWSVNVRTAPQPLNEKIFSIIEFESITLPGIKAVPLLLGIFQIQNYKIISKQIFEIKNHPGLNSKLESAIHRRSQQLKIYGTLEDNLNDIYHQLENTILVSMVPGKVYQFLNTLFIRELDLEININKISLKSLLKKFFPTKKVNSLEDVLKILQIIYTDPLDFQIRMDKTSDVFIYLLNLLSEIEIYDINSLFDFLEAKPKWVDFSKYRFNKQYLKELPASPGVYLLKDKKGNVFYVGKSKNLKVRIESYFINRINLDEKGKTILENIYDISFELVGSELEALLLENKYINQFQPVLNTQLKVHPVLLAKYENKRLILFLPSAIKEKIKLFLVYGTKDIFSLDINCHKSELKKHRKLFEKFFFDHSTNLGDYTSDQIEIFWRWFQANEELVNFLDIQKCVCVDNCLTGVLNYIQDKDLFRDKIVYF